MEKRNNVVLLPRICLSFCLSLSLAPTVSCLPWCSAHPLTRRGPPSTTPWELLAYKSPSTSHWPHPGTFGKFLLQAAFNALLEMFSYLGFGTRESPYLCIIFKLFCLHSWFCDHSRRSSPFFSLTLLPLFLGTVMTVTTMRIVPLALPPLHASLFLDYHSCVFSGFPDIFPEVPGGYLILRETLTPIISLRCLSQRLLKS